MSTFALLQAALVAVATFSFYKALAWSIFLYKAPLRRLRGPTGGSLLTGHTSYFRDLKPEMVDGIWVQKYGKVMRLKILFGTSGLFTTDTRALNHIMTHSMEFTKPKRNNSEKLLGEGVLFAEGEQHRQQRRIMNPTFAPSAVKALVPVFVKKSNELTGIWKELFAKDPTSPQTIQVMSWLSRATLDIIGLAGFDYSFNALNPHGTPNELSEAFSHLFKADGISRTLILLASFFPFLDFFVKLIPGERKRKARHARETMARVGRQLLLARKEEALGRKKLEKDSALSEMGLGGRDLLSALVRANMDTDLPASQRLSDKDVLDQIPTFLIAGHETTATEMTWCLLELARNSEVQEQLRAELMSVSTDEPSADELNNLSCLDAVIRETLRFHAAVPNSLRQAQRDEVIPVSEPYIDRDGKSQTSIRLQKGDQIIIPILALNRSKDIWGADADTFNPGRWASTPEAAKAIPGVWGHMLTFLGGSRACIGYRFALYEMKALLFALLRSFRFEMDVSDDDIGQISTVVTRPVLKSNRKAGPQLPLKVTMLSTR